MLLCKHTNFINYNMIRTCREEYLFMHHIVIEKVACIMLNPAIYRQPKYCVTHLALVAENLTLTLFS